MPTPLKEKRCNVFPVRLSDKELNALEALQASYASSGVNITKSALVRYGLKRLPHQSPFAAFP